MSTDTVAIPIKVLNLPDLLCVKNLKELIQQLPDLIVGEAPTSITNVVISNAQPLDTQRDSVWFRKDNAGNFLGIYVFSSGTWRQMFPVPNSMTRVYRNPSDSTDIPIGYTRFDLMPGLDPSVIAFEVGTWMPDPVLPGEYCVYSVVFSGF